MSTVISLRLRNDQMERLRRSARRRDRTASETAALLIEENLRAEEYAYIQFRDSPVGRQAYISGSSLAVWEVMLLQKDFGGQAEKVAAHLEWPLAKVRAAMNYAAAYQEEVSMAIADNQLGFAELSKLVPTTELFPVTEG